MSDYKDKMKEALIDKYGPPEKKPLMVKVNVSWLWKMFKKLRQRRKKL